MNKNSNTYIIIYSTVMVVVVALVLAFAATSLKERQNANVENEMKGAILQSIGQAGEMFTVPDRTAYLNEEYNKYITESFAVKVNGQVVTKDENPDADAFFLLTNLKSQYDRPADQRLLPVFVSTDDSGLKKYIFPVRGAGLWGPIWGYIALDNDLNTIYNAVFDHQGETPGLGAEIATPTFTDQFKGKSLYEAGRFVSITVLKGSGSSAGNPHAIDAISGGTITSKAVETMITKCLSDYNAFIEKTRSGMESIPEGYRDDLESPEHTLVPNTPGPDNVNVEIDE